MENSGLQKQENLSADAVNRFRHRELEKSCVENTQHRGQNRWKNTKVQKFKTVANYQLPNYPTTFFQKKRPKKIVC